MRVGIIDYLIAIPVAIVYWWQNIRDRCPASPDGKHGLTIVRDWKSGCEFCGKEPTRVAPRVDGKDE